MTYFHTYVECIQTYKSCTNKIMPVPSTKIISILEYFYKPGAKSHYFDTNIACMVNWLILIDSYPQHN